MNTDIMNQIEAVGSRLEKERLLAGENDTRFLKWALDPIITFGVTADSDVIIQRYDDENGQEFSGPNRSDWWNEFDVILGKLSRRELTGNAAESAVTALLRSACDRDDVIWAGRVINKDLRCGVQVSTANKVFPGLIDPFAVMLAAEYEPDKHSIGSMLVEPKLDGLRMVVISGQAFTRNGRTIETVGHILAELAQFPYLVFDGEVMGDTDFDADSGRTRRKSTGTDEGLKYNIFDVVTLDEWKAKKTAPLRDRKLQLKELFETAGLKHCSMVPWQSLAADMQLQELSDKFRDLFVAQGYEGCMLKDPNAPYVFKRSDKLLKFKPFHDADLTVVGFQEGRGRHKGRLGALLCEDENGIVTRVGSGFEDSERDAIWSKQDVFLGRIVEVKFQQKTPDGKLRFPVFLRTRCDKD